MYPSQLTTNKPLLRIHILRIQILTMKFTLFSTLTLVSYVLSAPAVEKDIAVRDKANLGARRLPLPLPAYALPRIGVTVTSNAKAITAITKGKSSNKGICRRSSSINRHESLVTGMGRVADVIKARCNDIGKIDCAFTFSCVLTSSRIGSRSYQKRHNDKCTSCTDRTQHDG
jgi:hypothetical protein